jgi:hypothetical protein
VLRSPEAIRASFVVHRRSAVVATISLIFRRPAFH